MNKSFIGKKAVKFAVVCPNVLKSYPECSICYNR